jgi:hypothetical protein
VFPEAPPLVPEEVDQEAPFPVGEVASEVETVMLVERLTVTEHLVAVEFIPASPQEPHDRTQASEPAA